MTEPLDRLARAALTGLLADPNYQHSGGDPTDKAYRIANQVLAKDYDESLDPYVEAALTGILANPNAGIMGRDAATMAISVAERMAAARDRQWGMTAKGRINGYDKPTDGPNRER